MNVAVNLFLASPKSVTGAFIYIEDLLPRLFRANRTHTYHLLGQADTIAYFKSKYAGEPNVRFRVFDIRRDVWRNPARAAFKLLAKLRHDRALRERILAREVRRYLVGEKIALYFSPSQVIYPRGIAFDTLAFVTTMLDIQFEYFPEYFSAAQLAARRNDARYAVEHSDRLIAISAYTKQTLTDRYGADPHTIRAIHLAPHETEEASASLALPETFVFYPAALWPHKNHRVLIDALAILKDEFPVLQVVFTGVTKRTELKRQLEEQAAGAGLRERVIFAGYCSGGDLRRIYTQTKALVFPSSFEGFGIPLVEGFLYGVPVIGANNTSIAEVVDGAGLLVPTGDAEALAGAIARVLTDETFRDELIRRGHERSKLFSWEKTAQETLDVFRDAVRTQPDTA